MKESNLKNWQLSLAEVSRLLLPFAVIWLLGAIGLGWIVKSLLILVAFLFIAPIVAFFGFRWWLKRNLIQSTCPVCQSEFVSLNQSEFSCPNCSESLKAEAGQFIRSVPPGTIDVSAIEVPTQQIED